MCKGTIFPPLIRHLCRKNIEKQGNRETWIRVGSELGGAMPEVNIIRVNARQAFGGHGVPEDKIRSRYSKALALIPQLVEISDIVHIYDNTIEPFRIFKKRKDVYYHWDNEFWNYEKIQQLTGISDYSNSIPPALTTGQAADDISL